MNKKMSFSCTLAAGMEVSAYFAPAITVIELAQETSICISGSPQNGYMQNDDLDKDFDTILDD